MAPSESLWTQFFGAFEVWVEPVCGEVKGKMNHISFQNFYYEAAVDPSEHTDGVCPGDKLNPGHGSDLL